MAKFWTQTKLKAFADDKIDVAQTMFSVFDKKETIMGQGVNSQHFPFPARFSKALLTLSQTTNFRLFHTERVCRQPFLI